MYKKISDKEKMNKEMDSRNYHDIIRFNLFIIRELYQFVAIKESVSVQNLYTYLFADDYEPDTPNISKKCADKFYHALTDSPYAIQTAITKLVNCGISPEYFSTEYIKTNEIIESDAWEYLLTERNNFTEKHNISEDVRLTDFRESLSYEFESITNMDGTPLITHIRILILNASNYKGKITHVYNVAEKLAYFHPEKKYNTTSIQELYKRLGQKYLEQEQQKEQNKEQNEKQNEKQNEEQNEEQNKEQSKSIKEIINKIPDISDKNIYSNKIASENIKANYFIIRELYLLYAEMDDIGNALDKFYATLNITEEEYEKIISTGIANNKYLSEKLLPFHFPVNMFRGDKPTLIKMHPVLKNYIFDYLDNSLDYTEFLEKLRIEILYINHAENITLIFPIYSLFCAVKENQDCVDIDWLEFAINHPELVFK